MKREEDEDRKKKAWQMLEIMNPWRRRLDLFLLQGRCGLTPLQLLLYLM